MSDEQDRPDRVLAVAQEADDDAPVDVDDASLEPGIPGADVDVEDATERVAEDAVDQEAADQDAIDPTDHDTEIDAELDRLDDGGTLVGAARGARSEALPFMMSTREHFAALDAVEPTGDARVDAATARLDEVPDLPTPEHVEVYDDVLRRLHDALSDADVR